MSYRIDVEASFTDFVRQFGGEVVEDLVGSAPSFPNADFMFHDRAIVAELKRLSEDKSEDQRIQKKIQAKFDRWMETGKVPQIFGTRQIDSKTLPEECQKELIEVYKPPIQRRIIKANKQIKNTMRRLAGPDAKGVLLLVNDGNYALEADAVLYLVWRVLGDRFSHINSVVYFTVNMFAYSPETPKPALIWAHASREESNPVDSSYLMELYRAWSSYHGALIGENIEMVTVSDPNAIESIRYAKRP